MHTNSTTETLIWHDLEISLVVTASNQSLLNSQLMTEQCIVPCHSTTKFTAERPGVPNVAGWLMMNSCDNSVSRYTRSSIP